MCFRLRNISWYKLLKRCLLAKNYPKKVWWTYILPILVIPGKKKLKKFTFFLVSKYLWFVSPIWHILILIMLFLWYNFVDFHCFSMMINTSFFFIIVISETFINCMEKHLNKYYLCFHFRKSHLSENCGVSTSRKGHSL